MSKQIAVQTPPESVSNINELIIDSIQDIKGKNIVKFDLRDLAEAPTNYFIICEGESNTQVRAIADNVTKKLKQEAHILPNHVEGSQNSKWILLDYFNTVVHVFYPETRQFYQLEELWGDAKITEYQEI